MNLELRKSQRESSQSIKHRNNIQESDCHKYAKILV